MRVAIVTGASSGIGEEFCRALDGKGLDSIWAVARRADRLEALASSLKTPCRIITADLSTDEGVDRLLDMVDTEAPDISFLINCAGFGRFGITSEMDRGDIRGMVSLNCTALSVITAGCIPHMSPGSHIIEVCSASAYLPLKELNVYSATKSYVRSFCNGLRRELMGTGISVLEVSPGWVRTDFIDISMEADKVPAAVFRHTVTKEEVVRRAMSDLGKRRSVCGSYNTVQVFTCSHLPRLATAVWERSLRRR